jgi:hypothetical protein
MPSQNMNAGYRYSYMFATSQSHHGSSSVLDVMIGTTEDSMNYLGLSNSDAVYQSGWIYVAESRDSSCNWDGNIPVPVATAPPVSGSCMASGGSTCLCGNPGVFVSKHKTPGSEIWVRADEAHVEIDLDGDDGEYYFRISGSYLARLTRICSIYFGGPVVKENVWVDGTASTRGIRAPHMEALTMSI